MLDRYRFLAAWSQAAWKDDEGDYYETEVVDGVEYELKVCGVCGGRKQRVVKVAGKAVVVNMACNHHEGLYACNLLKNEQERERKDREVFNRQFASNRRFHTFAEDDGALQDVSDYLHEYVTNFSRWGMTEGVGVLLWGKPQQGKTFYAECVAVEIGKKHTVRFTTAQQMVTAAQSAGYERAEIVASLLKPELLVIDDIGAERQSQAARAMLLEVIDGRICGKRARPIVVTTNLTPDEMNAPEEPELSRIYSRITAHCMPVCCDCERKNFPKIW